MIEIPLTKGYVAVVDDEDAHLTAYRWTALVNPDGIVYARRFISETRRTILLHHDVLAAAPGMEVDHINRNGLDCRRHNLRPATRAQNMQNRRRYKSNTSGFKGVNWIGDVRAWRARIQTKGQRVNLGLYPSPEAAARAYDAAALEQHGEFASLNFPLETQGVA